MYIYCVEPPREVDMEVATCGFDVCKKFLIISKGQGSFCESNVLGVNMV